MRYSCSRDGFAARAGFRSRTLHVRKADRARCTCGRSIAHAARAGGRSGTRSAQRSRPRPRAAADALAVASVRAGRSFCNPAIFRDFSAAQRDLPSTQPDVRSLRRRAASLRRAAASMQRCISSTQRRAASTRRATPSMRRCAPSTQRGNLLTGYGGGARIAFQFLPSVGQSGRTEES